MSSFGCLGWLAWIDHSRLRSTANDSRLRSVRLRQLGRLAWIDHSRLRSTASDSGIDLSGLRSIANDSGLKLLVGPKPDEEGNTRSLLFETCRKRDNG